MDVEHDPVDPSLVLVQFFEKQESRQNSAEKEERVDAREAVENGLEGVRLESLKHFCSKVNYSSMINDFSIILLLEES